MILQKIFLINFCIFGLSIAHPTERSVIDENLTSDDSYQEIFPVPLIDYLKENNNYLTNNFNSNPIEFFKLVSNQLQNDKSNLINHLFNSNKRVNLHALPTIKLDQNSFIITHRPNQNQYLDLGRINEENKEKKFILTELKDPLTKLNDNNDLTSFLILHYQSNQNLTNINLSLSFSQPTSTVTTTTVLPELITKNLNASSNLTSLNAVLTDSSSVNSEIKNATLNLSTSKNSQASVELISTNIEKPKELFVKKSKKENPTIKSTNQDEIDANQPLTEELDGNNSTSSLSKSNYSSLSDDVLIVNDAQFNQINPISFDLINDQLNDTIVDN